MLRKKAAEELKKEQERKAAERRRIIEERCGSPKDIDNASEGKIISCSFAVNSILQNKPIFSLTFTKQKII